MSVRLERGRDRAPDSRRKRLLNRSRKSTSEGLRCCAVGDLDGRRVVGGKPSQPCLAQPFECTRRQTRLEIGEDRSPYQVGVHLNVRAQVRSHHHYPQRVFVLHVRTLGPMLALHYGLRNNIALADLPSVIDGVFDVECPLPSCAAASGFRIEESEN
jgi:hypothetical protein